MHSCPLIQVSNEVCSSETEWQIADIGSGNGMTPKMRQAIMLTNDDLFHLWIYASPAINVLTFLVLKP